MFPGATTPTEIDFTAAFLASGYGIPLGTVGPGDGVFEEFGVDGWVDGLVAAPFGGWEGHGTFSGGSLTLEADNLHGVLNPVVPTYPGTMEGPWVLGKPDDLSGLTLRGSLSGSPVEFSFGPGGFNLKGIGADKHGTYTYAPAGTLVNNPGAPQMGGTLSLYFPDSSDFVTISTDGSPRGLIEPEVLGAGWNASLGYWGTGKVQEDVISGIFVSAPGTLTLQLDPFGVSNQGNFFVSEMDLEPWPEIPHVWRGTYSFTRPSSSYHTTQSTGTLLLTLRDVSETPSLEINYSDIPDILGAGTGTYRYEGGFQTGDHLFGTFTPTSGVSPSLELFPSSLALGEGVFEWHDLLTDPGSGSLTTVEGGYRFDSNYHDVGGSLHLEFWNISDDVKVPLDLTHIPGSTLSGVRLLTGGGQIGDDIFGTFTGSTPALTLSPTWHGVGNFTLQGVAADLGSGAPRTVTGGYFFNPDTEMTPYGTVITEGGTLILEFPDLSDNPWFDMVLDNIPTAGTGWLHFEGGIQVGPDLGGVFINPGYSHAIELFPGTLSDGQGEFVMHDIVHDPPEMGPYLDVTGDYTFSAMSVGGSLDLEFHRISDDVTIPLDVSSPALPGSGTVNFGPDWAAPTPGARVEDDLVGGFASGALETLSFVPAGAADGEGTFVLQDFVTSPSSGLPVTTSGHYHFQGNTESGVGPASTLDLIFANLSDDMLLVLDTGNIELFSGVSIADPFANFTPWCTVRHEIGGKSWITFGRNSGKQAWAPKCLWKMISSGQPYAGRLSGN